MGLLVSVWIEVRTAKIENVKVGSWRRR